MVEYFRRCLVLAEPRQDRSMIALCLAGLAGAARALARPRHAARLFGAAEALREAAGGRIDLADREPYERNVSETRRALGDEAFSAAWSAGRELTPEQAMGDAWQVESAAPPERSPAGRAGVLSRREREVAELVARGLTNRQIAGELSIAERTVGTHIEHIMAKLRCHARAQIAAWVVEHGAQPHARPGPRRVA
jgi:DNA-binding NarL/FixJ family response regulator